MLFLVGVACAALLAAGTAEAGYLGKEVGALSQLHHAVRGRVYAVDSRTLYLHDFHYDGEGPAAYFYVGTSKTPSAAGALRLRDERGGGAPLRRYRGESVTLSLPEGKTLRDVAWFSVWCDEYSINFGSVEIPRSLEFPKPAKVGALRGVHGVSSDPIVVVDAQTLLVPNFSYDGEAPDAKFWVGRGDKPSPQGIRIPDENGKETPLRKYDRKTIVLTLPGELTVFDIGHFAVWCEAFTVNFGHVVLPRAALANVPPSLKMLGVSPQSKLNCEVLQDDLAFEVRWAIAGDSIVLQLVAKLEDGEYMSFGISGSPEHSQMVGGDVAVGWVDKTTLKGYAEDYYLDAKSQCAGVHGSCPDERLAEGTNSVRMLNAALVNGYSIVTYQRPLKAADHLDLAVLTNATQPIIWAIGPLNSKQEVSYHQHFTKGDKFIEFGRPPLWNCPMPEEEEHKAPEVHRVTPTRPAAQENAAIIRPNPVPTPKPAPRVKPWDIPGIQCYEPPDGVFYAQMGPTGGKQGYPAITGHVGWGISWYINGLLIPEVTVVRGKKYTFVVEGGSDPEVPARYHPFYITNDPVGGYHHKSDAEKKGIEIYAGVRRTRSGELIPTGVGRLCNWTPDQNGPEADEYPSFGAYQRSLTLVCEEGNPGVVTWTPDRNTPDTVYYQCFTHRHLGWKINVVDECDITEAEESRVVETLDLPEDLASEESIQVQNRVKPDVNFLNQRQKVEKIINTKQNYNDFSSNKGDGGLAGEIYPEPPRNIYPGEQEYELPITKVQIKKVIEAVESLEEHMKEEMKRNATNPPKLSQYQVHEDVKELFVPEQPIREGDEYVVDVAKLPESFLLPPNLKPQTLHNVLRPNSPNKPMGNMRPPFRRPAPPEIKLRRPYPMHQIGNNPYPLPMPNPHGPYGGSKKPNKYPNNRPPPNMNRPPQNNIPPMKAMPPLHPPKNIMNRGPPKHTQKLPYQQGQPIIMGKPNQNIGVPSQSQTLSLGHTDLIANQVVKSQITLPGANEPVAQQSAPPVYFNKPGQIILGKPMDHPLPLDQQMIPNKQHMIHTVRVSSTPLSEIFLHSSTTRPKQNENTYIHPQTDIKSSDFIGQSTDSSTFTPAVNTGFKPDSIVIESGFKPIIREPLMAGVDKIADYQGNNVNRREDTDVEEDYDENPQYINTNHAYSSDKITETFEPMFIPSPEDHLLSNDDKTKEVFPKNHAREDRPHPVYVKTQNELNALFGKKNMNRDVPSDMMMESDKVSPQYLPPASKNSKEHAQKLTSEQTFTTYDGKTVSAASLTSVPEVKTSPKIFSSKLPANTELLLKTPQFGPFKGEIPPVIAEHIKKDTTSVPAPVYKDTRTTHLKLVQFLRKPDSPPVDDLKSEASEITEEKVEKESKNDDDDDDDEEEEEYEEDGEEENRRRRKRDTKAAQFERDIAHEETTVTSKKEDESINHIEFDLTKSAPRATSYLSKYLLITTFLLKFF
ncbi:protein Skeletor, isoforms D/E isoform X1 [Maniola jurtina]|uniref:protein Skeletor, isoforms D/E isoform X1 n=2 Tax=Maniola jurtina TaxID=191418 RepID=UPI001E68DE0E|nr:protein Skeletor, isoforms D/E isoform X1 [Maniola jurtina]